MTHTFNLVPNQQITPERFFSTVNSYQLTEAIKSAIELEIFTAISEGNTTSQTISKRCHATERGVRILCDFLTIHGFLTKQGAAYSLPEDSALFLDRHSPAYVGSAIEFLLTPRLLECHAHLTEAVRRGGTALGEGMLDPESPDWVKYALGMMPMARRPAEIIATELRKDSEAHKSSISLRATACLGSWWQSKIPPRISMPRTGRTSLKSRRRMRMRWALVIGTTLSQAAPPRPSSATAMIWPWLLISCTVSTRQHARN